MSGELNDIFVKQKYNDLFDGAIFSLHSSNKITEEMNPIFKKGAKVHIETADYLAIMKKE